MTTFSQPTKNLLLILNHFQFLSEIDDADLSKDYWQHLESEWDNLAKEHPEHEWLAEYDDNSIYRVQSFILCFVLGAKVWC